MATPKVKSKATQDFVIVQEVRDGTIILQNGGLRAVLMTSSVNFALKSADEQEAMLLQFQNLLNSLEFSLQIFMQSKRLDIRPYIALLEEEYKKQTADLLKLQTREYIEFIKNFTDSSEIMTKSFFVVIPYAPAMLGGAGGGFSPKGIFSALKGSQKKDGEKTNTAQFEEMATQLDQRVDIVAQGLTRIGIRSVRLGSEEVIELLYKIMNPGELEKPVQLH